MRVTEAPETRQYLLDLMRKKLDAMPRVLDPGVAHTSELSLCPMKPHYARTLDEQPPLSRGSTLQCMRGRGLEFCIGGALPVLTNDGICGTIDPAWTNILELKSTQSDMGRFNPNKPFEHWLISCKGYCYLADTNVIDLAPWFLNGDMYTTRKSKTDLLAWHLEFTDEEIAANWDYLKGERAKMFACIDAGTLPDEAWVKSRRKHFECPGCRYAEIGCPYWNGGM